MRRSIAPGQPRPHRASDRALSWRFSLGFVREPRGAWRRRALACPDVFGPQAFVLLGRDAFQLGRVAAGGLLKDLLQKRNTPAAAGAGPATLRELARHPGLVQADEVLQL